MGWKGFQSRLGEANFSDDEEMRPTLGRKGVHLDMSCPHCSAFSPVTIEWPEVIALAQGKSPPGFAKTVTGHTFSVICPRCEQHYKSSGKSYVEQPGMNPQELREVQLRRREISMTRPIGIETVLKWLSAAKRHGLI